MLSHELRSPLNPILGWAQLLRSHTLNEQQIAHGLEVIEHNANLQTQLIEDLLDVSRILRGKLSLNTTSVDLATVISAALETASLATNAKSIQLCSSLNPDTLRVSGDAVRPQHGADLDDTSLHCANLDIDSLQDASLKGASLSSTSFRNTNVRKSRFIQ